MENFKSNTTRIESKPYMKFPLKRLSSTLLHLCYRLNLMVISHSYSFMV